MTSSLLRYGYVPFMILGIGGAALALAHTPAAPLWLLLLVLAGVGISFAVERMIPYTGDWNTSHNDAGRDAIHGVINEGGLLLTVLVVPIAAALSPFESFWPNAWPLPAQVLLAVLVTDLGITLVHFASHKIGVLWRFHAVHHSVRRFYGFNGLMKHPLHGGVELLVGTLPLLILGMPAVVAEVLAVLIAVQLLLQHSNADYRVGPLRYVLALNEGHRFHHLKWAGIGDVNFGLFTLIWDHLLGTFSFDPQRRFTSDDLGMAAKPNYPDAYLAQLAEPFRRSGACTFTDTPQIPAAENRAAELPATNR
ncbi:sterol desaturase family protein [Nocardia altamirensis]|uniref:sterol desaturase family protein n=1 Tax=Nocardia altamirensis TaxID=472158 RepID=UPI00083FF793|nr:sterol desaturase family protein [Nocardia altamirensis]